MDQKENRANQSQPLQAQQLQAQPLQAQQPQTQPLQSQQAQQTQAQQSQTQPQQAQQPLGSPSLSQPQPLQQTQSSANPPISDVNSGSFQPTPASPPLPPHDIQPPLSPRNLFHNKIVIFTMIALLCLGAGLFILMRVSKNMRVDPGYDLSYPGHDIPLTSPIDPGHDIPLDADEPTPSEKPLPTIPPYPPPDWKVYDFIIPENIKSQFSDWKWRNFTLYFPNAWSITTENYEESPPSAMITFSHTDGSSFMILQGFGEGGKCLYPNDPDYEGYEGMAVQFVSYDEVVKADTMLRLSKMKDPLENNTTHYVCGKDESGTIKSFNMAGFEKVNLKGDESYAEFLEMLRYMEMK